MQGRLGALDIDSSRGYGAGCLKPTLTGQYSPRQWQSTSTPTPVLQTGRNLQGR